MIGISPELLNAVEWGRAEILLQPLPVEFRLTIQQARALRVSERVDLQIIRSKLLRRPSIGLRKAGSLRSLPYPALAAVPTLVQVIR